MLECRVLMCSRKIRLFFFWQLFDACTWLQPSMSWMFVDKTPLYNPWMLSKTSQCPVCSSDVSEAALGGCWKSVGFKADAASANRSMDLKGRDEGTFNQLCDLYQSAWVTRMSYKFNDIYGKRKTMWFLLTALWEKWPLNMKVVFFSLHLYSIFFIFYKTNIV